VHDSTHLFHARFPLPDSASASETRSRVNPLQAAAILAAAVLLARFIGLLQRVVLNGVLPTEANDAYTAAFRLPDIINYLVAGGAMSVTFIPISRSLNTAGRAATATTMLAFFSTVATLMSTALLILIVIGIVWSHELVSRFAARLHRAGKGANTQPDRHHDADSAPAQFFFYVAA
jgi:putative peptidoglycan lipid II flippase